MRAACRLEIAHQGFSPETLVHKRKSIDVDTSHQADHSRQNGSDEEGLMSVDGLAKEAHTHTRYIEMEAFDVA